MSLTHAILGLLLTSPMTGYDLKTQCFDRSIGYFWPADQAQIYRTLDNMEETGWVTSAIQVQERRPNRKVYQITNAGREVLREWLHEPDHFLTFRDPFLIQTFFAGQLSDAELIDLFEHHIQRRQAVLEEYQQLPVPLLDVIQDQRDLSMGRLTLEFGLRFQQMYIDWLKLAIETVQNLEESAKKTEG